MRDFLTLAHQASYIASAGNYDEKRTALRRVGPKFRLAYASLSLTYTYPFKTLVETANESLGWLTGFEPVLKEPQSFVLPLHHSHQKLRSNFCPEKATNRSFRGAKDIGNRLSIFVF